jgi:hypothetical protein
VPDFDGHLSGPSERGADREPFRAVRDRGHRLDCVHDEIQEHLLQLDAIAARRRESWVEIRLDENVVPPQLAARELQHLANGLRSRDWFEHWATDGGA